MDVGVASPGVDPGSDGEEDPSYHRRVQPRLRSSLGHILVVGDVAVVIDDCGRQAISGGPSLIEEDTMRTG